MDGEYSLDGAASLWKDRARAFQLRIRDRFRVAVDRHRHWKVEADYSSKLRRWILRLWGDSSESPSAARPGYRFYRKRVGKDVEALDDSFIVRLLQALAVPIIGNACHVFMHGFNNIQIYGAEKLHQALSQRPDGRPLLTVSNHVASIDDPFVIASLLPPSFMLDSHNLRWTLCASDRCFSNPMLSSFFRCVKVLPVSRGDGIYQKGMDVALSKLNRGGWVHIFPEGSRSRDGGRTIASPKRGVGRLVMDADSIPVVIPFAHTGMQEVMPIGSRFPKIGKTVTVVVGDPIPLEDLLVSKDDAKDASRGILYDAVSSRIGRRLQELKVQADRFALERATRVSVHRNHNNEHGYRIWQQVDWETFGMGNISSEDDSQIVKQAIPRHTMEKLELHHQPDTAHRTIRMGLSYEGGIVSRVRGCMNPPEFMGFAVKGLFMNGNLLDESFSNIGEVVPVKAWKQFFEGGVFNLLSSM